MDDGNDRQRRGPQNRQRERVLRLVRDHDGALDASELANRLGVHVTTARFHLDALCERGLVARTRIAPRGVGRPRTGYVAVQAHLDYRMLAEILALELGDTAAKRRRRAERAGRRWAQRLAAETPRTDLDRGTERTAEVFQQMGFGPELKPSDDPTMRTIHLHACPVRELAAAHPEVGCALHRGLLEGLLDEGTSAELEPFVEPELCIATVIADE